METDIFLFLLPIHSAFILFLYTECLFSLLKVLVFATAEWVDRAKTLVSAPLFEIQTD